MKKIGILFYSLLVVFAIQGCSKEASNDLSETGQDIKKDIGDAGRNAADMVQDSADHVRDAAHDATH